MPRYLFHLLHSRSPDSPIFVLCTCSNLYFVFLFFPCTTSFVCTWPFRSDLFPAPIFACNFIHTHIFALYCSIIINYLKVLYCSKWFHFKWLFLCAMQFHLRAFHSHHINGGEWMGERSKNEWTENRKHTVKCYERDNKQQQTQQKGKSREKNERTGYYGI